jgi:Protein of unknown function (DUF3307)
MPVDLHLVFLLLCVFQVKHFVCDFPLQRRFMLQKVLPGWEFFFPLVVHCLVHAIFTLAIILWIKPELWWLALVDFVIHFLMDRIKAGPKYLGRFRDRDKASYWNALGFDQMVHHLTGIFIVWVLVQ